MKKGTRIVKRLLALFLVVLMSINSFGAVVSDNDGSAFITKAEFDSLKNNFQTQIDQYNTSIDSKINGAIASYLAGINVAKKTIYAVEVAEWEEIIMLSKALEQKWKWPNLNIAFAYAYNRISSPNWYETWWARASITYTRAANEYQLRNCVNAGAESTTNKAPDNVVWVGRARNYIDTLNANQIGDPYVYLSGATYSDSVILLTDALNFGTGYLPSLTLYNKWRGGLAWWNAQLTPPSVSRFMNANTSGATWSNLNVNSSINIETVDGEQYDFHHILTFNNDTWSALSDPNWSNTLNDNPSYTQDDVLTSAAVTKVGSFRIFEMNDLNYSSSATIDTWQNNVHEYSTGTANYIKYALPGGNFKSYNSGHGHDVTSTAKMKSVGVLNKTYTSSDIYQWAGKRKSKRNDNVEVEKTNLYNGALIAYAKSEESFAWEPIITGTYKSGTTDVAIRKWRVKLSDKPFGTGDSLGVGGKVLKNVGQTNDYLVTDDSGKCKFNIELGENTTIWCKWWPDDTNICNNYDWQGTLDLTQCGTYTITES